MGRGMGSGMGSGISNVSISKRVENITCIRIIDSNIGRIVGSAARS